MSSPKAAAKGARRPSAAAKASAVAAKATPKPKIVAGNDVSAKAVALAAEIEHAFAKDEKALSVDALQTLMGALCRIYSTQVENGATYTPVAKGQVVSPTAIVHTASGLLRAGDLSVYELGFWQNATGR